MIAEPARWHFLRRSVAAAPLLDGGNCSIAVGVQDRLDQIAPPTNRRILLVEDHPDSAETMAMLLRGQGHEVLLSSDGPTALEEFERSRPHVLVCDIDLAGEMDGLDVARALRRADRTSCRLIAVSGFSDDAKVKSALHAGFDAYLVKPIDFDRLLAEIDKEPA